MYDLGIIAKNWDLPSGVVIQSLKIRYYGPNGDVYITLQSRRGTLHYVTLYLRMLKFLLWRSSHLLKEPLWGMACYSFKQGLARWYKIERKRPDFYSCDGCD